MADKVRVGVIGLGNMGSGHIRNFAEGRMPEIDITAIADIDEKKFAPMLELVPQAKCFGTATELMHSGLVDAILICTPHYFHPPMAIEGLNAGLHVMSEKPAGVYTKQVRELIAVADKSDKTYAIMFNQRTNCIYRKVRELVQSGAYGEMKRVSWIITDWFRTQAYYESSAWRATWEGEGGGVMLNQCPHQLDLWQWICGMPTKIRAICHEGKWHDIEVEDDVTAYLEFDGGATGVFITTTGEQPGTNRLEISCDRGKLIAENDKLTLYKLPMSEREFCVTTPGGFDKMPVEISEVPTDGKNEQHVAVLNAFAGKILRGEPLIADGCEGIRGLTLSNAMHLSSWLGKPVDVPFDEALFLKLLNERRASSRRKEDRDVSFSTEGSY